MRPTKTKAHGPSLRALTTALALALLAALLLAGAASAAIPEGSAKSAAKPGTPTAKAPAGTIAATMPTFKWSRAVGAAQYKLSVYEGSTLLFSKGGLSGLAWKSTKTLPQNVTLTWKVRAQSAGGLSAWSGSLSFKIATASQAKAITAFGLWSPAATGVIDQALHTVALTVPYGTDVTDLVPTITITGVSVSPDSGVATDFTSPVTYTVSAADGDTQPYIVTVTAIHALGDVYQGGKVAYILETGDFGYSATVQHGLIAAIADQTPSAIVWALPAFQNSFVPGGTELWVGTGAANTDKIVAQNGAGNTYAAGAARSYNGGGYSDWYLPSREELNKLYLNRGWIGGFFYDPNYGGGPHSAYWSSSEGALDTAWTQRFSTGKQECTGKNANSFYKGRVRAVRAF